MSYGIYVHIPFCRRKCAYCDFVSVVRSEEFQARYVNALVKEIAYKKNSAIHADTVYIGGGTPSLLKPDHIVSIAGALFDSFSIDLKEFTLECNPESVTKEKIRLWKEAGVGRVSLGVQSLSDPVLKILGRVHTGQQALKALRLICDNFENVSVDLMCALPGQTLSSFLSDLKTLTAFPVSHISVYQLITEESTPLYKAREKGEIEIPDDDFAADCYEEAVSYLKTQGLYRYEISNFARRGYESAHNLKYWNRDPYLGFGAAAHSFDGTYRFSNAASVEAYLENARAGIFLPEQNEKVEDALFETLMLGLRTAQGVEIAAMNERFGIDFLSLFSSKIEALRSVCEIKNGRFFVRDRYFNLLNAVLEKFL